MPTTPAADQLAGAIADRTCVVGIVGLGYVGLPLARAMFDRGVTVVGYDIDPSKAAAINEGRPYIAHLGEDFTKPMAAEPERFIATDDPAELDRCDAIVTCVPTPLDEHRKPDLSYVESTCETIAKHVRPDAGRPRLVINTSTSYPGTTRDVCLPILEKAGFRQGETLFLAFSPEREDPGNASFTTSTIPRLVGGLDEPSTKLAHDLLAVAVNTLICTESAEVAEAAKLLENIHRSINIALVNEMKTVLGAMGIDVWQVLDAAATKPFGFTRFNPGPGLGGHCIPIDPYYLAWKAEQIGVPSRFIELAGQINHDMPARVIDALANALSDGHTDAPVAPTEPIALPSSADNPLAGKKVLVIGLAYKKNVADVRESPALVLIEMLREHGAEVSYHDPHVPSTHKQRKHDLGMTSTPLTPETLAALDAVLIATDHDDVDWELVANSAPLIVDTRGRMRRMNVNATLVNA